MGSSEQTAAINFIKVSTTGDLTNPNDEAWKPYDISLNGQPSTAIPKGRIGCDGKGNIIPYLSPKLPKTDLSQCKVILQAAATASAQFISSPQYSVNVDNCLIALHEGAHAIDFQIKPDICKGVPANRMVSTDKISVVKTEEERKAVVFDNVSEATAYHLAMESLYKEFTYLNDKLIAPSTKGEDKPAIRRRLQELVTSYQEIESIRAAYIRQIKYLGYMNTFDERVKKEIGKSAFNIPKDIAKYNKIVEEELDKVRAQYGLQPIATVRNQLTAETATPKSQPPVDPSFFDPEGDSMADPLPTAKPGKGSMRK